MRKVRQSPTSVNKTSAHASVEGAASGETTRAETAKLKSEQRHIRRTERRAKADGRVTPAERANLQRKQNKASRDIRRQKHDAQEKP